MVELPADIREALERSRAADEPGADDQARVANALAVHLGMPAATWSSPPPSAAKPAVARAGWGAKLLTGAGVIGLATTLFVAVPALRNLGRRNASSTTSQLTAAGTTDSTVREPSAATKASPQDTGDRTDPSEPTRRSALSTRASVAPPPSAASASQALARGTSTRGALQPAAVSASQSHAHSASSRDAPPPFAASASLSHAHSASSRDAPPPFAASASLSHAHSASSRDAPPPFAASASLSHAHSASSRDAPPPFAASASSASTAARDRLQPPIAADANPPPSGSPAARDPRKASTRASASAAPSTHADASASSPPSAADSTPDSELARELALVRGASRALDRSKPDAALQLLNQHAREFAAGTLASEREALRVSALCRLGRAPEARSLRDKLAADLAHSPLRARIEHDCAPD